MAKRIRRVSDLPDWFRLAKYEGAAELDAAGWFEQLCTRRDCINRLKFTQPKGPLDVSQYFFEILATIREAPIVDATKIIVFGDHTRMSHNSTFKGEPKLDHFFSGVTSLTTRGLKHIEDKLSPGRREYLHRFWTQFKDDEWTIFDPENMEYHYPPKRWIDAPIHESYMFSKNKAVRLGQEFSPITVDLSLPDTLLINAFKLWLANARKETGMYPSSTRYRKPDFESWTRFGVLPWLDLTIWQEEVGLTIPSRVMADAIFPYGEGGEETVRKTTKPMAMSLIENEKVNDYPLFTLAAQAAHELHDKIQEE